MNNTNLKKVSLYVLYIIVLIYLKTILMSYGLVINDKIIILISLGMLYLLYQKYRNNDIIILVIITILYLYNSKVVNNFTDNTEKSVKYNYNKITIEEDVNDLLLKANNDNVIKAKIENKFVEAKEIINNNPDIKKFFIFNNLIDINGEPLYLNVGQVGMSDRTSYSSMSDRTSQVGMSDRTSYSSMSENIIMYNKIKIILILIKILS